MMFKELKTTCWNYYMAYPYIDDRRKFKITQKQVWQCVKKTQPYVIIFYDRLPLWICKSKEIKIESLNKDLKVWCTNNIQ